MFLELRKDFGDRMALVKIAERKAVLVLLDRAEQEGPFFTQEDSPHQYPIIKFERPPELCGVQESPSLQAHTDFRAAFLDALIAICKKNDIDTVLCVGTDNPNAIVYRKNLKLANIELHEFISGRHE